MPPLTARAGGLPEGWLEQVNSPQGHQELAAMRRCIQRGAPFGRQAWVRRVAKERNLQATRRLRPFPVGRPRKEKNQHFRRKE